MKNSIIFIFSLLLLFYQWIPNVYAQTCYSPDITEDDFDNIYTNPVFISVDHSGTIAQFEMVNTALKNLSHNNNMAEIYIDGVLSSIEGSQNQLLTIFTTDKFPNFELNEHLNIIMLTLSFTCDFGVRQLNFLQNIIVENRRDPEFTEEIYYIDVPLPLPQNFDLTLYQDIAATDRDLMNYEIEFSSDSEFVTVSTKPHTVNSKTSHAKVVLNQQLLKINGELEIPIVAIDKGLPTPRTSSALIILRGDSNIKYIEAPHFIDSLHHGRINENGDLELGTIVLDPLTFDEDVHFEIINGDFELFKITETDNSINVFLNEPLTDIDLADKQYLYFQIVAHKPDYNSAYATVLLNIPIIECELPPTTTTAEPCPEITTIEPCPEITTIEPCPECPECPDVTLPPINDEPVFQTSAYFFTINPNFIGTVGSVKATVAGQTALVVYSITADAVVSGKLQIDTDTGVLTVTEPIAQGVYTIIVTALNPINLLWDIAPIRLTVRSINVCPSGEKTVADTLLIRTLMENAPHSTIFEMVQDDCTFEIDSVIPNDKEYFTIDDTTNMLKTAILLDREDPIFADMHEAQIKLHLLLKCPTVASSDLPLTNFTGISSANLKSFNILTDGIPFSIDSTYLTIIVEDSNDNSPEFIFPLTTNYLIGYPAPDVAERILPPHLIQVIATDKDQGINAKIRFSLVENVQFWIDGETGVISPLRNSMTNAEDFMLTVRATDSDGNGNMKSTTLRVVRLEAKHLTYLTIENTNNDEIDVILNYIKDNTGVELHLLQAAVVPLNENTKSLDFRTLPFEFVKHNMKQTAGSTIVRLVVYAFANQRPILTGDLENGLKDLDETYKIVAYSYDDINGAGVGGVSPKMEEDFTAFIVVISLLSVLLLILAVVSFFGWWYWIRPYEYKRMGQNSETNLKTDFSGDGDQTTPPTTSKYAKKDSVFIHGVPYPEENDDVNRLSYTLDTVIENNNEQQEKINYSYDDTSETSTYSDGGSPGKERKKSIVTFNELVERIDIIETDDTTATQTTNNNNINNKKD